LAIRGSSTYKGIYLRVGNEANSSYTQVIPTVDQQALFSAGGTHTIKAGYDGTDLYLILDGEEIGRNSNVYSGSSRPTTTVAAINYVASATGNLNIVQGRTKYTADGEVVVDLPLQEGKGLITHDISGFGRHGTITACDWVTEDGMPSINNLNGFGGYIDLPTTEDLGLVSTVTADPSNRIDMILEGIFDDTFTSTSINTTPMLMSSYDGYWIRGSINVTRSTVAPYEGVRVTINPLDAEYSSVINIFTDTDFPVFDGNFHKLQITVDGGSVSGWVDDNLVLNTEAIAPGVNPIQYSLRGGRIAASTLNTNNRCAMKLSRCRMESDHGYSEWIATNLDEATGIVVDSGSRSIDLQITDRNAGTPINSTADIIRYPVFNEKRRPIATFDGVDDYISLGTTLPAGDFELSAMWMVPDFTAGQQGIILGRSGDGIRIWHPSNDYGQLNWRMFLAGTNPTNDDDKHSTQLQPNTWYALGIKRVGTTVTLSVDGVEETFTGRTTLGTSSSVGIADPDGASRNEPMSLYNVAFTSDSGMNFTYKLDEGNSTRIIDSSGNGFDKTATNISTDSFWAQSISADDTYNLTDVKYGPVNNLAGYVMNRSGTTIRQVDTIVLTDPFWTGGAKKTQDEIIENNDPVDTVRSNDQPPYILDILTYTNAPTDGDLDQLNEYLDSRRI
jgi:hypothetical protein